MSVKSIAKKAFKANAITEEEYKQLLCVIRLYYKSLRPQGEWIDYSADEGYIECPKCGHLTNCEGNIDELHYCWNCGAKMRVRDELKVSENVKPCSSCAHFNDGNRKPYPCGRCFIDSHNMWEAKNE